MRICFLLAAAVIAVQAPGPWTQSPGRLACALVVMAVPVTAHVFGLWGSRPLATLDARIRMAVAVDVCIWIVLAVSMPWATNALDTIGMATIALAPARVGRLGTAMVAGAFSVAVLIVPPQQADGHPAPWWLALGLIAVLSLGATAVTDYIQQRADALVHAEVLFRAAFLQAANGLGVVDGTGSIVQANGAFAALVGRADEGVVGLDLSEVLGTGGITADLTMIASGASGGMRREVVVTRPDERQRVVVLVAEPSPVGHEGEGMVFIQLDDITDQRRREDDLGRLAHHDPLTGLANRALARDVIDDMLHVGRAFTVLYLDLDGFKAINDQHGHAAGDDALRLVAERLRASVRQGDLAVRLGGDEFVVVAPELSAAGGTDLAQRIEALIRLPAVLPGGIRTRLGASIGMHLVEQSPEGEAEMRSQDVLAKADEAMFAVKRTRGTSMIDLRRPEDPALISA